MEVISSIICERINGSIIFHEALHGYVPGRGMGTAIMSAKLFQQLTHINQRQVRPVFIDLHKAFDSIDCEHTLEILSGYGLGPKACALLQTY